MELIEIVDKNGNFTGEVLDKDEAHDKNLLHNEVAVFVINNHNQVLLQKRSSNKRFNPNKWALCAGHVKAYECLEDAIIREIKEEIGINVSKNDLHEYGEKQLNLKNSNSHITYFYYVKINKNENEFIIQTEELSEVKWFDIDEVIAMIINNDSSTIFTENHEKYLNLFKNLKDL